MAPDVVNTERYLKVFLLEFMEIEELKRKKYIFLIYRFLFISKIIFFSVAAVWFLSFILIFFEPFLPSFTVGREGAALLLLYARESIVLNIVLFTIFAGVTIGLFILSNQFRKKNKDIIDFWNLGRY